MTMTDTPERRITKRDLVERGPDALDRNRADVTKISGAAGGVTFGTALEVIDFAKLMCTADKAIPMHLRNNPGACLRIVFQAVEWRMSPWAVADKSYEVRDRIAYESQLIHAVIESRAPLQKRLDCRYGGEGPTRTCTVVGFFDDGETREYTTPEFQKITVKNSPLWASDPDQQLFYYASRSWARKWCPDVLMGIYSREELAENPSLGRDPDEPVNLHQRLATADRGDEGHRPGHVESELDQVAAGGKIIDVSAGAKPEPDDPKPDKKAKASRKKDDDKPSAKDEPAKPTDDSKPEKPPTTVKEYITYATVWINAATESVPMGQRWSTERKLRNELGMTAEDRKPLETLMDQRRDQLEG